MRQSHPVLQAFISLLSLPDSLVYLKDAGLLTCLCWPHAQHQRRGLRYPLRQWVNESCVMLGIDDDNVHEPELPPTGQHTALCLTRMLLGYAMESSQERGNFTLPYNESSGLIADLVGHLASLLALNRWRRVDAASSA